MEEELFKRQVQNALNRAYFYLKFRPRTKREVEKYLLKKAERFHWPQEVVEKAISYLVEQKYINDTEFIDWFIRNRNHGKPKGEYVLKQELMRFGVPKDSVDEFFESNEQNEDGLAIKALNSKWHQFKNLTREERLKKVYGFLGRRGFPFSSIKNAVAAMEEKE